MKNFQFPTIKCIDDVLPAIEGSSEFIVANREHYTIVNYVVSTPDTFPPVTDLHTAIRRECRGIVFDTSGKIISRRLHKFFNVNEREETLIDKIDLSQPHVILEKLDGSMITPIYIGTMNMRWGTKMGVTDVAMNAEAFVAKNSNYDKFAWKMHVNEQTPIFEWCSNKNKIVVDHPEERLVLIAIRDNASGEYANYTEMKAKAAQFDIDLVKQYPGSIETMTHLIDETKDLEDAEGWIVRFDDGHMVKIKGEWYVKIHRAKDDIGSEKKVLQLLFNDKLDDVKALLPEDDRKKLAKFHDDVLFGIQPTATTFLRLFKATVAISDIQKTSGRERRKEFAKFTNDVLKGHTQESLYKTLMFRFMDIYDQQGHVDEGAAIVETINHIKKNLSSQTQIDNVRFLWGGIKWEYYPTEDNT